jgi:hypothetical protein
MHTDPATARTELAVARALREEAEPRWRAAIVAARRVGVPAAEVALIAGCTRQRVHQIEAETANRLDVKPAGGLR